MRPETKEIWIRLAKSAGRGAIVRGIAMAIGEPPSGAIMVGLEITTLDYLGRIEIPEISQSALERESGMSRKRRPRRRRERS